LKPTLATDTVSKKKKKKKRLLVNSQPPNSRMAIRYKAPKPWIQVGSEKRGVEALPIKFHSEHCMP
jgi:hypothetical protein